MTIQETKVKYVVVTTITLNDNDSTIRMRLPNEDTVVLRTKDHFKMNCVMYADIGVGKKPAYYDRYSEIIELSYIDEELLKIKFLGDGLEYGEFIGKYEAYNENGVNKLKIVLYSARFVFLNNEPSKMHNDVLKTCSEHEQEMVFEAIEKAILDNI